MNLKSIHLLLVLLIPAGACLPIALAQEKRLKLSGRGCSYDGSAQPNEINVPAGGSSSMESKVRGDFLRMCDLVGLTPNVFHFSVDSRSACPSAIADVDTELQMRVILYNPTFLAKMDRATGTDWPSKSIIAHELGHHLNNDILGEGDRLMQRKGSDITPKMLDELNADRFSGFILGKLGATLEEAQSAIAQLPEKPSDRFHPGRALRLNAIKEGWEKEKGITAALNRRASR